MRRSRRRLSGADRAAAAVFHEEGLRPGVCQVCLKPECVPLEVHHPVDAQRCRQLGIPVYDVRNSLCTGAPCHMRHTSAQERIPMSCLRPETFEFAAEFGVEWHLERFYPDDRMRCIG